MNRSSQPPNRVCQKPENSSARLTRVVINSLDYDFEIRHVPSHKTPHANGLIRVSWLHMKKEAGLEAAIDLDAPKEPVCAVTETGFLPYSPEEWRQKQSDDTLAHIIKS